MKGKTVFLGLLLFLVLTAVSASKPPSPSEREAQRAELKEKMRKAEERMTEHLKESNPSLYEERVRMKELSQKIHEILDSFRKGKLDEETTRRRLSPLVRQTLERRIQNLDQEIEWADKKSAYLKKAKKDPGLLVKQQIDIYLGKSTPEERLLSRF